MGQPTMCPRHSRPLCPAPERVYPFLFIALPIRFVGATGSWIRPVEVT